jgi:uncharacterized RDD family membrane protein YckC
MAWADDVRIETPEQIDVSLEVAGLGSRFVAQVVDWLIKGGAALVILLLAAIAAVLLGVTLGDRSLPVYLIASVSAVLYFAFLGYDVFCEVRYNGQTIGKWLAGVRVIKENGAPVDVRSACLRFFLAFADFLPVAYLLGSLLVLVSSRGQRLGDMAAGTLVIRERAQDKPVDPSEVLEKLVTDEFSFTGEQLAACSVRDRHILRTFLQRYDELEPRARSLLALRLAGEYGRKTAYPARHAILDGPSAEAFLATLYRDLESRARHG